MSRASIHLCAAIALSGVFAHASAAFGGSLRGLTDPTRPPDFSEVEGLIANVDATSAYVLSAILMAQGRSVAVINGVPVQAGDRVNQAEVVRILGDRVVLREKTGELTLRLIANSIRSPLGAKE